MRELQLVLIVVGLCFLMMFLKYSGTLNCNKSHEGYGAVLGQLAPYQKQLNQCLTQCEKSDPNTRLLPQANINCGMYCESIMTDMANRGIPPSLLPISDNETKCERQCQQEGATENERRKCLSMCVGRNDAAQWCKEIQCPYSLFDEDPCMRHCTATKNINNNQVSWSWKMSR